MARAASEIIDVKSWWIRLCNGVSVVAFEPVQERTRRTRRERTPFLLGLFTLSQFLLGSSSPTLQANPTTLLKCGSFHAFTHCLYFVYLGLICKGYLCNVSVVFVLLLIPGEIVQYVAILCTVRTAHSNWLIRLQSKCAARYMTEICAHNIHY